jgi:hypothetical protein
MEFYLGTHHPGWLGTAGVPLFVSARRLRRVKRPRPAACRWALDGGGFTELKDKGRWSVSARDYAGEARRWHDVIGRLDFCAPQDWMCEPVVIAGGAANGETFVGTGLSVREHQRRTTANFLELCAIAPELPWLPVLQGWHHDDYLRHAEDYAGAGVSLTAAPLVGLGSVCRRQDTRMAEDLARGLHGMGLRLHAFGFKLLGLARCARYLASSDSMAWSREARWGDPLPGCTHRSCANCPLYALAWRRRVLDAVAKGLRRPEQLTLFP